MSKTTEQKFREAYERAKAQHLMSFVFGAEEYSMGYASYLINHELPLKREHETTEG